MKLHQEITRADFIQAVKDFKKRHNSNLRELLKDNESEITKTFLSDPVIHGYLTRSMIAFKNKHPDLQDSKIIEEHCHSDHYELKVYKYLPNVIAYRDESIIQPTFYERGTYDSVDTLLLKLLQTSNDTPCDLNIDTLDRISASIALQDILYNKSTPLFRIDSPRMTEHATTVFSIFHPINKRLLVTLFLDSQGISPYNSKFKYFFKLKKTINNYDLDRESLKNTLMQLFSIDIDDSLLLCNKTETILINYNEKAACVLNSSYNGFNDSKSIKDIEDSPDIKTVFHITTVSRCRLSENLGISYHPYITVTHKLDVPFIDVSHDIQKRNKDCSLYSFNFIQAITTMLKSTGIADHLLQLAQNLNQTSQEELKRIFQEDLKKYLPFYYEQTGSPKSEDELSDFHLRQRWGMGRMSLLIFHPPKKEATKENGLNEHENNLMTVCN